MTINTGGAISWPTTDANAYTTNVVVAVVEDGGTPLLSASQSFTVIVLPRVQMQFPVEEVVLTDPDRDPPEATQYTTFSEVSWSTKPGHRYGFHNTGNLSDQSWNTNMFDNEPYIEATGTKTSARGPFIRKSTPAWGEEVQGPSTQFFRIIPVP